MSEFIPKWFLPYRGLAMAVIYDSLHNIMHKNRYTESSIRFFEHPGGICKFWCEVAGLDHKLVRDKALKYIEQNKYKQAQKPRKFTEEEKEKIIGMLKEQKYTYKDITSALNCSYQSVAYHAKAIGIKPLKLKESESTS